MIRWARDISLGIAGIAIAAAAYYAAGVFGAVLGLAVSGIWLFAGRERASVALPSFLFLLILLGWGMMIQEKPVLQLSVFFFIIAVWVLDGFEKRCGAVVERSLETFFFAETLKTLSIVMLLSAIFAAAGFLLSVKGGLWLLIVLGSFLLFGISRMIRNLNGRRKG